MSDPDSGDLLLVAAGDGEALERIVARWKLPVFTIFERTRDAAAASEATADVFDRLRQDASRYEPGIRPDAFLHRLIAERILGDAAAKAEAIPPATLAASGAARNAFVRSAVAALPPFERAAFLMTRVAGLPNEAAADALRTTVPEVQKHVVHALALLRASLEPAARLVPDLGPVERHFAPSPAPAAPADLDHRLALRLYALAAQRHRFGRAALVGAAVGAIALLAAFLLLSRGARRAPAPPPAGATASAAPAPTAAPDILRVKNAPVFVDTVPANAAEVRDASALFPPSFLLALDSLAALDPLFPEDVAAPVAGPPSPRPTQPARTPDVTPEELGDRIAMLRHLSAAERSRINEIDAAFRERPEFERAILWSRWTVVRGWSEETMGGLRPLAARLSALAPDRRAALAAELRALRDLPKDERLKRFRALPFARELTGQERAAAEAILG